MKPEYSVAVEATLEFLKGLLPGAFGAAVSVAFDHSATLARRLIQFAVGIAVSYYVGAAAKEWFELGPMVNQGVAFTVGMVAYQSVPSFTKSTAETAGSIPKDLWRWVRTKLGIKDA